jgi:hypothetical protein
MWWGIPHRSHTTYCAHSQAAEGPASPLSEFFDQVGSSMLMTLRKRNVNIVYVRMASLVARILGSDFSVFTLRNEDA